MTDEVFTASNGVVLDHIGNLNARGGLYKVHHLHEARKEFYQHLRDQELGRWRDPEDPDWVVYPMDGGTDECRVSREKYPLEYLSWKRWEIAKGSYSSAFGHDTAKRYFDAHPETKPWHEAQPGEVWLATFDSGVTVPLLVRERLSLNPIFYSSLGDMWSFDTPAISHAERIYPREEKK